MKKKSDFADVFDRGRKIQTECFTVYFLAAKQKQVGLIVSKKHGNAVERNKIKRRIRALYSNSMDTLPCDGKMIVIPSGRIKWRTASFCRVSQDWQKLLEKLSGLC